MMACSITPSLVNLSLGKWPMMSTNANCFITLVLLGQIAYVALSKAG